MEYRWQVRVVEVEAVRRAPLISAALGAGIMATADDVRLSLPPNIHHPLGAVNGPKLPEAGDTNGVRTRLVATSGGLVEGEVRCNTSVCARVLTAPRHQ
jgi:hypothetical protein